MAVDARDHLGLVYSRAFAAERRFGVDAEELVAAATIGLVRAATTFKPQLGYQFSSLALTCIDNEILREFRRLRQWRMRRVNGVKTWMEPPPVASLVAWSDPALASLQVEPDESAVDAEMDAEFYLSTFTDRERFIAAQRRAGRTLDEIGKALGVSKERIRQIIDAMEERVLA